jgi:hypothetical protein
MTFNLSFDILFETSEKLSLTKARRFCFGINLREPHFLDYSEVSVYNSCALMTCIE